MKKRVWLIGLVFGISVMFVGALVGCRSTSKVQIGLLADLSGQSASIGIPGRDAARLAVDRYNEDHFGTTYELVVKDTMGSAKIANEQLQTFLNDSIQLIIGPYTSAEVDELHDQLNTGEVLFMSPTVAADSLSQQSDYFYRVIGAASLQAETLAKAAYDIEGDQDVLVIYERNNESFCKPIVDRFDEITQIKRDQAVEFLDFDSNKTEDFGGYVDEVIKKGVDGVLFIGPSQKAAVFLQQLTIAGYKGNRYLTLWSNTKELVSGAGDALNGAYVISTMSRERGTDSMNAFSEAFYNRYHYDAEFVAYFTDEAVMTLLDSVDKSKSFSAKDVKAVLDQGVSVKGYTSDYQLDDYGDSNKAYILMRYVDNAFVKVN